MSSFTTQELKDLYQALNMSIDWHSELDALNKLKRLHELQSKIDKMIKGKESRPVIADGVEYDSYADYLKSRGKE